MRRIEVLEHGQPLLEVGEDRRLDDRAVGARHEATHAGQLLHLLRAAAGARMAHHVDGVHLLDASRLWVDLRLGDFLHHFGGDLVGALRPGVDDEVVLLLVGGQAVQILLLKFAHLVACLVDQLGFRVGHDHVVLAERDAGLARLAEAEAHDSVGKQHRLLLAAVAINLIDDVADLLLTQQAVHQLERDLRIARQMLGNHHAAGRRLHAADDRLVVLIHRVIARLDLGVQRHAAGEERVLDLADVVERHAFAGLFVALLAEVIEPEHDILRRHDDRLAVRRAEDVVGGHH